ncbi:MAG: dTDP-4-dehydrorhamnose reductase [Bacteroidales bacterium]|nr:dTDP-4-dehydrorhamnose reductase [Bacteroidales bacterium]
MEKSSIVLVTGSNGQLGSEIKAISNLYPTLSFIFTDVNELNITDSKAVEEYIKNTNPSFVINCAAYTAVDKSETEMAAATLLNSVAPRIIANACKANGCKMIHISTDYVFDGDAYQPYNELSPVNPTSHYGKSKLKGEENVIESGVGMVIRTSWLYSSFGHNFVKTIIRNAKVKPELRVVFDQVGCPTYAKDLADVILKIISSKKESFVPSVFHYSNEGVCSWYDFAFEIVNLTKLECKIIPIETKDYPLPAKRPHYSVFNKEKIRNQYGLEIPHWSKSLSNCINIIMKDGLLNL